VLIDSWGICQVEIICFNLEQQLHTRQWDKELMAKLQEEVAAMVELVRRCLSLKEMG
jgi:two-component system sensor histidine kinase/response regulator